MNATVFLACSLAALAIGCHSYPKVRLADQGESATARVSEQHEFEKGHVFVWWVDGKQVRDIDIGFWGRVELEIEVEAGEHVIECSFRSGYTRSTENAVLALVAHPGHHYEVKAEVLREGFWREFGKEFQARLGGAKGSWAAWIEDKSTGAVVSGVRPSRGGPFTNELPESKPPSVVPEKR